jgi:nucleotide-binding universal stress UspA family protein
MFKRILLGFDGSEHAQRAARLAADIAHQEKDAQIWVVVVVEPIPTELGKPFFSELILMRTNAGEELLSFAKDLIGEGVSVHDELLFAAPAESIIEVADTQECDLIVMGTRGLGGLRGLLLGSQIHKVISLAKCPVLAVK